MNQKLKKMFWSVGNSTHNILPYCDVIYSSKRTFIKPAETLIMKTMVLRWHFHPVNAHFEHFLLTGMLCLHCTTSVCAVLQIRLHCVCRSDLHNLSCRIPQVDLPKETLINFLSLEVRAARYYYELFSVNRRHSSGKLRKRGILSWQDAGFPRDEGNPLLQNGRTACSCLQRNWEWWEISH